MCGLHGKREGQACVLNVKVLDGISHTLLEERRQTRKQRKACSGLAAKRHKRRVESSL